MNRKETRKVKVGNIYVGGDFRVSIQSMTNTDTKDVEATVKQIKELQEAGCDIVRCAVLDMDAACAIKDIVAKINIPLVADIHFDYRLALKSNRKWSFCNKNKSRKYWIKRKGRSCSKSL